MWESRSKYQRIGALLNANHLQLKTVLAPEVRKFGLASLMAILGEFPLFDGFWT